MKLLIELSDNIRDKAIRKELGEQYEYIIQEINRILLCKKEEEKDKELLQELQLDRVAYLRVLNNYVLGGSFATYFESGLFHEEFKDAEEA
jgi:hypothetical protein